MKLAAVAVVLSALVVSATSICSGGGAVSVAAAGSPHLMNEQEMAAVWGRGEVDNFKCTNSCPPAGESACVDGQACASTCKPDVINRAAVVKQCVACPDHTCNALAPAVKDCGPGVTCNCAPSGHINRCDKQAVQSTFRPENCV